MKLRKTFAFLSIAAMALVPVTALAGGENEVTLKGEVLDLACYISHDSHGEEHSGCAVKCVKGGQPMGLKAEDGTVYVLFADHGDASAYEKAKEHAGTVVQISGLVSDRAGVKGITVHEVKEL